MDISEDTDRQNDSFNLAGEDNQQFLNQEGLGAHIRIPVFSLEFTV